MRTLDLLTPEPCFELRFTSIALNGRAYAFPCDACGNVDLDMLGDSARDSYLFARACVGFDLYCPIVRAALLH
jgi:hypothetical protein